jgi:hypothetical protein
MWELIKHWLDTRKKCPGCEAYSLQVTALSEVVKESQRQVGMVLGSHYDRPVTTGEFEARPIMTAEEAATLSDVQFIPDDEFLRKIN